MGMLRYLTLVIALVGLTAMLIGCSGSAYDTPLSPAQPAIAASVDSHNMWGFWQLTADPAKGTLDVVQLRGADFHLNALPFLEPPPLLNLTLESLQFNGNIIEADIGLRHPFLGLNEFTGFDVCGVLITNGSVTGFSDTDLRMAGTGDTRLLNADGLTRWWNPAEFPVNTGTMFGYNDGLLGTKDNVANYNCTLNGYKYFGDGLDPDDPVGALDVTKRSVFGAGQKNIRHYTIELGDDGLVFNYAVDANWQFPTGDKPWEVPDDFAPEANRPEAWNVVVTETGNTLWNDGVSSGGNLSLQIDIWDHYNADLNTVTVESPGNFTPVENSVASGGGDGFSTYEIDIIGATPSQGSIEMLISVACEVSGYGGLLPGKTVAAYFMSSADVSGEEPGADYTLEWDSETTIISNQPSWNDISPALAVETDNQTVVAWNCDNPGSGSTVHYQNFSRTSDGLTWPNGTNCFPGGSHKGDQVKCAAGTNGTSFSTFATVFSSGNPPYNPYGTRNENYAMGGNYCFPANDLWSDIEMFVAQTGMVFVFTDYNSTSFTAGIIDTQHSNGPNTLDGGVSWAGYPVYSVTTDGLISHSRSIGDTSDGAMHLIYYAQSGNAILLVSSTDGSTGHSWGTPDIVNDDSGYSGFFDPSLKIDDDDEFHASWLWRKNSDSTFEILYSHADNPAGPYSNPVVAHSSTVEVKQPAIDVMPYPQGKAIFISWVQASTVFLTYSLDGVTFSEPIVVQQTYSPTQQADCIVDHMGNLQVVWSQNNSTSWDITARRARLVEN